MARKRDKDNLRVVKPGNPPEHDPDVQLIASAMDPGEMFKAEIGKAIDCSDQVIVICCVGGYVNNILSLRDDRHNVIGALMEALDLYSTVPDAED